MDVFPFFLGLPLSIMTFITISDRVSVGSDKGFGVDRVIILNIDYGPMITALESRILDANSESMGVSVETLMRNAGLALAEFVGKEAKGRILFICGSGNNGGDGYAAYMSLKDRSDICAFKEPKSPLCRRMAEGIRTIPYDGLDLDGYDVIVDCVLGTGPSGSLRPEYADYINRLNSSGKRIISCDVPTGFGTDTMIRPYATITFHDVKKGMGAECGIIRIRDIGIPPEASLVIGKGDFLRYPVPKDDSHKGQNGRLLIVGGGPYVGAPIMAAKASLRTGVDLVTVMSPKGSFLPIASYSPAYMVRCLSGQTLCMDDVDVIIEASKKADAVLIGPGLGTSPETAEAVRVIAAKIDVPAVIDADGITCISGAIPKDKHMVFTPHAAELARLTGRKDPGDGEVSSFCRENGCVILRKGRIDSVYDGKRVRENRTGSPGMTVGGTGDVLAGTVAGLMAKGMSGFDAACLGAHICGLAGEFAYGVHSYGMNATDVIDGIGRVLKEGLE
jgi:NAD(P)H-hydrate epimerase